MFGPTKGSGTYLVNDWIKGLIVWWYLIYTRIFNIANRTDVSWTESDITPLTLFLEVTQR